MKKKIEVTDDVKRLAESYSIPASKVRAAYQYECAGGYGGLVIETSDGRERHQGCGHPMCSMCEFEQGIGVGNEACADFAAEWIRTGNMPPYVKLWLSHRVRIAEAAQLFSKNKIGFADLKRIVRKSA
jgi:hypothetical protein